MPAAAHPATCGLRHRPATAIVDALAVTPSDSDSLALWNAHVERTRAAARTFKAGWPSPRLAARDPCALRALVLIACIATFVAAGGERWKRIAAAFDWQGVVLPANFRVDAWVTPPAYTGKPPIILAGIHPGETARAADAAGEPVTVPAGSTLVVRATGRLRRDRSARDLRPQGRAGGERRRPASAVRDFSLILPQGRRSHERGQQSMQQQM